MPPHGSAAGPARSRRARPCAPAGRRLSNGHPRQPSPSVQPSRAAGGARPRSDAMRLGVPLETAPRERRVALVPDSVARLGRAGLEVLVERGAGLRAGFPDQAYHEAGAALGSAAEALAA